MLRAKQTEVVPGVQMASEPLLHSECVHPDQTSHTALTYERTPIQQVPHLYCFMSLHEPPGVHMVPNQPLLLTGHSSHTPHIHTHSHTTLSHTTLSHTFTHHTFTHIHTPHIHTPHFHTPHFHTHSHTTLSHTFIPHFHKHIYTHAHHRL